MARTDKGDRTAAGSITRSRFLKVAGAAGTLALLPGAPVLAAGPRVSGAPKLDLAGFARLTGTSFRFRGPAGRAQLELTEVTDRSAQTGVRGHELGAECFILQ